MKRYELKLPDGRTIAVRASAGGAGTTTEVEIDGETFRVEASERFPGAARLVGQRLLVSHPDLQGECELRETPRSAPDRAQGAEASDLRAPFPGKVVKILVAAPVDVVKGEPLVVLEAMKMEFTYTAPRDLRIEKALVREGQQVEKGAAFFEFA